MTVTTNALTCDWTAVAGVFMSASPMLLWAIPPIR